MGFRLYRRETFFTNERRPSDGIWPLVDVDKKRFVFRFENLDSGKGIQKYEQFPKELKFPTELLKSQSEKSNSANFPTLLQKPCYITGTAPQQQPNWSLR